jgi:hypothetical protein
VLCCQVKILGRADHSSRGAPAGFVCRVTVITEPQEEECLVTLGLSRHENKICSDNISSGLLSKSVRDETHKLHKFCLLFCTGVELRRWTVRFSQRYSLGLLSSVMRRYISKNEDLKYSTAKIY